MTDTLETRALDGDSSESEHLEDKSTEDTIETNPTEISPGRTYLRDALESGVISLVTAPSPIAFAVPYMLMGESGTPMEHQMPGFMVAFFFAYTIGFLGTYASLYLGGRSIYSFCKHFQSRR